ncbi:hypothetical protein DPMN_146503 [Dreissena polymorpha]|uniref:Uncharacterized protein n=1 Tax=Dreissena polymorpha TaxID=45954 RepID=A0A9D4FAF5_DREPO|nr:hypothetical protein DPMN_146503 [Dreissena polymorpha]
MESETIRDIAGASSIQELGDRAAQGRACGNLGNTHYLLGNFSQAIIYHQELSETIFMSPHYSSGGHVVFALSVGLLVGLLVGAALCAIKSYKSLKVSQSGATLCAIKSCPFSKSGAALCAIKSCPELPFWSGASLCAIKSFPELPFWSGAALCAIKSCPELPCVLLRAALCAIKFCCLNRTAQCTCNTLSVYNILHFGDKAAERRAYSNLGNAQIFLGEFEVAAEH